MTNHNETIVILQWNMHNSCYCMQWHFFSRVGDSHIFHLRIFNWKICNENEIMAKELLLGEKKCKHTSCWLKLELLSKYRPREYSFYQAQIWIMPRFNFYHLSAFSIMEKSKIIQRFDNNESINSTDVVTFFEKFFLLNPSTKHISLQTFWMQIDEIQFLSMFY